MTVIFSFGLLRFLQRGFGRCDALFADSVLDLSGFSEVIHAMKVGAKAASLASNGCGRMTTFTARSFGQCSASIPGTSPRIW